MYHTSKTGVITAITLQHRRTLARRPTCDAPQPLLVAYEKNSFNEGATSHLVLMPRFSRPVAASRLAGEAKQRTLASPNRA